MRAGEDESLSHSSLTLVSPIGHSLVLVQPPLSDEKALKRMKNLHMKRLTSLILVGICSALIAPAFAVAQTVDPTADQYDATLQQVAEGGSACENAAPGSAAAAECAPPPQSDNGLGGNVGPLPFTGFDVIAMAAVALAVTGLGLGLQRAVSRDANETA